MDIPELQYCLDFLPWIEADAGIGEVCRIVAFRLAISRYP